MKLAFSTLVGTESVPFEELLTWSAAHDIHYLEVNVGPSYEPIDGASFPGHLDLAVILEDRGESLRQLLAGSGVSIVSLAPMLNLLNLNPEISSARQQVMRDTIDAANALEVDTVVTFAGSAFGMHFQGLPGVEDNHPGNRTRDNIEQFRQVYEPLADYAGERGIRIAFETAGRGGGEGNIAHAPELWDAMFEAVPSAAIGLSFDPSHFVWLGIQDVEGAIRRYARRIYHVDAKDCEILTERLDRQGILGSNWWRYRLPGDGLLDWDEIIAVLVDVGYDGPISIENEDPEFPGLAGVERAAQFLGPRVPA